MHGEEAQSTSFRFSLAISYKICQYHPFAVTKSLLQSACFFKASLTYLYSELTSTAKQVLGNCERMVLANFIGNRVFILNNIMSEE